MGRLQTADAGFSFRVGLLLFLAMPTDIITMFTVEASLTRHGQPWWHSLPFVLMDAAPGQPPADRPAAAGKRGEDLLPEVQEMTNNSWVISKIVIASSWPSPSPVFSADQREVLALL